MVIRRATVDDAQAIADVHVRGWRAGYRGIVPDDVLAALSIDQRTMQWQARLAAPTAPASFGPRELRVWIGERAGRVDGFAALTPPRDADLDPAHTAELMAIYLAPEAIGTGLGRALLEQAIDDAVARERRELSLWVFAANARARRFYERAGLAADGANQWEAFGAVRLEELRYRTALPVRAR